MTTSRTALIFGVLLLAACAKASPEDYAPKSPPNITDTSDFTVTAEPGSWRKQLLVQGYIANKRGLQASRIMLRVDGLDSTGKAVWSEVRHLDRDIPPNDRVFYQVPVPTPAPTYRVAVDSVFWRAGGGGP